MAKRRKKRRLTANKKQYLAEITRIYTDVSEIESMGFRVSKTVLPRKRPVGRVTKKQLEKLRKIKKSTLLDAAYIPGSGRGRHAKKPELQQPKPTAKKPEQNMVPVNMADGTIKMVPFSELENAPSESETLYNDIMNLINSYPGEGATLLNNLLAEEIKLYGKKAVLAAMRDSPGVLWQLAQDIVHYQEREGVHSGLVAFAELIKQAHLTLEESKLLGAAMDTFEYD